VPLALSAARHNLPFDSTTGTTAPWKTSVLISPEFASPQKGRALLLSEDESVSIMLCEEDHIRIQVIKGGLDLEGAFDLATKIDDLLDSKLSYAFDVRLGYLTQCPTNLGTGMRASVMMFLPALTMAGRINGLANQLSKIGLTMRGLYGEGTAAQGSIYQISNQITLGITEEDSIKKLEDVIKQLTESELELRKHINEEKNPELVDRICRAEGTLKHAFMLSSSEFISLFADIRLGISLGLIKNIDIKALGSLFIEVMPATLSLSGGNKAIGRKERDILRAKRIKEHLNSK
jgi:protein arginine kinase